MKTIRSVNEIDEMITACDAAPSDDALRAVFAQFRMEIQDDTPLDPQSRDYHDYQMDLYKRISGREYSLNNEATPFDVDQAVLRPFPYSTGSAQTAGAHFVVMGRFLEHLRFPPKSRIVEFGPGWGNLTLALAALGHQVTAVDVEPRFCELIRRRATRLGLSIEVINADFSWARNVTTQYDAAIFFECFHHSADHLATLRDLHIALRPGGKVYLGAEPILEDFPVPWGLRLDGQSLWSIRKFGWMELGFRDDYFRQALAATQWSGVRHPIQDPAIWELQANKLPRRFVGRDDGLMTITGQINGSNIELVDASAGFGLYGPYVALPQGEYVARIDVGETPEPKGGGEMQVCADGSSIVLATARFVLNHRTRSIELPFFLDRDYSGVEVRLYNEAEFTGTIRGVEVSKA